MKGGKSWLEETTPIGCLSEQDAWSSGRCPGMLRTLTKRTALRAANRGTHQRGRGFSHVARSSQGPSLRPWVPRRCEGIRRLSDVAQPSQGRPFRVRPSSNAPWNGGNLRCCAVGRALLHAGPGSSEKAGKGRHLRCCALHLAAGRLAPSAEFPCNLKPEGSTNEVETVLGKAANLGWAAAEVGSQVVCKIGLMSPSAQFVAAVGWLRHSSTRCNSVAMASRSLAARTSN